MRYLKGGGSYEELGDAWVEYRKHLLSIQHRLPAEVFQFASAVWHYDPRDHRSLHDSWLENLLVEELEGTEGRKLAIRLELLGAYHDGKTVLKYIDVSRYSAGCPSSSGHGDWMHDEVTLDETGRVVHEVAFSGGATLTIECRTFTHSTSIPPIREH